MKTSPNARRVVKVRVVALCLAILGVVVAEFAMGESLAAGIGQVTAPQVAGPQAPCMGISDLMLAARQAVKGQPGFGDSHVAFEGKTP